MRCRLSVFAALGCAAWASPLCAAEAPTGWQIKTIPYVWATGLDGHVTIKGRKADADISFGDLLENLDGGITGQLEASKGPWSLIIQGNYLRLSESGGRGPLDAEVDSSSAIAELAGAYRVGSWSLGTNTWGLDSAVTLEVLGGARYTYLDADLELKATREPSSAKRHFGQAKEWIDPIVGARLRLDLTNRFYVGIQGDIGGFGVGSDFTWNAIGLLGYSFTDQISAFAGYRVLDQDYEDGSGSNRFAYDVTTHGPLLGVSIRF